MRTSSAPCWIILVEGGIKETTNLVLVVNNLMFCFYVRRGQQLPFCCQTGCYAWKIGLRTSWQTLCGQQIEHALYCIVMKYFTWNEYPDNKSGSVKKKWKSFYSCVCVSVVMHFQGDNMFVFIYFKLIFNSLVESIFIGNYGSVIFLSFFVLSLFFPYRMHYIYIYFTGVQQ